MTDTQDTQDTFDCIINNNDEQCTTTTQEERFYGIVKWFNNKNGYGFITLLHPDGNAETRDIFVHHSAITHKMGGGDECYRYLILGEYVEFSLFNPKSSEHKEQCDNVTGIYKGKLMYQTKNDNERLNIKKK
jgi:cold shock CspA family protein